MSEQDARAAMEIGMELAGKYETAVKAMAEFYPDADLRKLLQGNRVGLATLVMRALLDAKPRGAA